MPKSNKQDKPIHSTLEKLEELEVETNEAVKNIEQKVVLDAQKTKAAFKGQIGGFLDFIREKGVVGLAVGIIIGTAVTQTVTSLVNGLINPLIGLLLPHSTTLSEIKYHVGSGKSQKVFEIGSFMSVVLNLLIVSAVVYFGVKALKLDKLDKKKE